MPKLTRAERAEKYKANQAVADRFLQGKQGLDKRPQEESIPSWMQGHVTTFGPLNPERLR